MKREYASWVNERQMQTTEEKVDTSQALDARSVDTECNRTESKEQDTSSRSVNDAHDDDVNIRPIYDEEPMAEVQTTAEIVVFAIGQQHNEQPEFNNEGDVVQNAKECHDTSNGSKPMPRRNTQTSRNWPASKNSFVTTKTVSIAEHPVETIDDRIYYLWVKFLLEFSSSAIFTTVASLFYWQWELSSLAVGTSSGSRNSITGSGIPLCILFPTILT
uniref:Uncharacterized protein n=1 Tax=Tanacetum cinerariifolium TaxID=118510 RepID=A0A6L2N5W4_TANCI|nr:hypothetical protein [Tanacetum cinerariifolium]